MRGDPVAGYVIAIVDVTDPDGYAEYARRGPATIAKYDGRYLVRSGKADVREGQWTGSRTVILEFPSLARALEWYESAEYEPLRPIRQANSTARIAFLARFEGRIVVAAAVLATILFGSLALLRHWTFHSTASDLAVFDQVLWNTIHGRFLEATLSLPR